MDQTRSELIKVISEQEEMIQILTDQIKVQASEISRLSELVTLLQNDNEF